MANGVFEPYLSQSSGYAIILGGGSGFALFMLILSWLQTKFTNMSPFESEFDYFYSHFLLIDHKFIRRGVLEREQERETRPRLLWDRES